MIMTLAKVSQANTSTPENVNVAPGDELQKTVAVEKIGNGEAHIDDILLLLDDVPLEDQNKLNAS